MPSLLRVFIVNGCGHSVNCDLGTVGICILIKGCFSEVVKSLDNFFPNSLTLGSIGRLYTDMGCIFLGLARCGVDRTLDPRRGCAGEVVGNTQNTAGLAWP